MKVSVVIPVYNEEKVIRECLESLFEQTFQDFEVIVVDDGSTDSTPTLLSEIKKPNLHVLKQDHKGPATARNLGARRAKGEALVFVDADMTFDKRFLLELTEPITKGKHKGTTSHEEYVSNWGNSWARMWSFNQGIKSDRLKNNKGKKDKVFRAILKSEFDRVFGFDIGGYTDDYTLSKKLGYEATVVKGARFYHQNPQTITEVYKQARWAAKREYKLGRFGAWMVFARYSLPFTKALGIWGMIRFREPKYLIFKFVYNTAMTMGILEYNLFKKGAK